MKLLRSGVDLLTIQAWLGHAQVATTHRYAAADVEMMRRGLREGGRLRRPQHPLRPTDAVMQLLDNIGILCGGGIRMLPALAGVRAPPTHNPTPRISGGSRCNASCTCNARPFMPRRMSVRPTASQTRTSAGIEIFNLSRAPVARPRQSRTRRSAAQSKFAPTRTMYLAGNLNGLWSRWRLM